MGFQRSTSFHIQIKHFNSTLKDKCRGAGQYISILIVVSYIKYHNLKRVIDRISESLSKSQGFCSSKPFPNWERAQYGQQLCRLRTWVGGRSRATVDRSSDWPDRRTPYPSLNVRVHVAEGRRRGTAAVPRTDDGVTQVIRGHVPRTSQMPGSGRLETTGVGRCGDGLLQGQSPSDLSNLFPGQVGEVGGGGGGGGRGQRGQESRMVPAGRLETSVWCRFSDAFVTWIGCAGFVKDGF